MKLKFKNFKIVYIETVDSTNNYAKNLLKHNNIVENTVILTDYQTKGRGQKENKWLSEKKKNLTFSIVIFPQLKVEDHFFLSIAVSLGILDCISNFVENIKLKWPNDIYYFNKKLGGILIENSIKQGIVENSIIGIGININQTKFFPELNATSLKLINNKSYNRFHILYNLLCKISNRIEYLKNMDLHDKTNIKNEYLKNLYLLNKWHNYFLPDGKILTGKIIDIENEGRLIIKDKEDKILKFNFKEICFFNKELKKI